MVATIDEKENPKCDLCGKETKACWFTAIAGEAKWVCVDCYHKKQKNAVQESWKK